MSSSQHGYTIGGGHYIPNNFLDNSDYLDLRESFRLAEEDRILKDSKEWKISESIRIENQLIESGDFVLGWKSDRFTGWRFYITNNNGSCYLKMFADDEEYIFQTLPLSVPREWWSQEQIDKFIDNVENIFE